MSSMNDSVDFIYANHESKEYDVQLATSFDSQTRMGNVETRSLLTSQNPVTGIFNLHEVKYDQPLRFDIIIVNCDGSFIDTSKERELKKWLMRNKKYWFQVEQDDMCGFSYYCIATESQILDVGAYSGGMKITFECDTYHAWTELKKKTYTTSGGTLSFNLNGIVDFEDYITYPTLTINPTSNGNIRITNNTTGQIITINNCVSGETIILDCSNDIVESSNGRILVNDWNVEFLELKSAINNITLTGNFTLKMEYRLPVRIGA